MTHAFFKALLFMAAGSVIAAMGGIQDLDRMGGFRKAMPFTFGCMVIGGLALSGFPPFSGFFSKDDIIAHRARRAADWHIVLGVAGYVGALLTAIYTFRMIFRAFFGDPCPEARELEHGHLHHADVPINPATGEQSRTPTSASPAPSTTIAEREPAMKIAMGALAVLAIVGGFLQVPASRTGCTRSSSRPSPTRSRTRSSSPRPATAWIGLIVGAVISHRRASRIAYFLWVLHPERPAALRERFAPLHRLFVNKWYFDEAIDLLIVRPCALGRPLRQLHHRARRRQRRARRRRLGPRARRRLGRGARRPVGLPALLRRAAARRRSPALGAYFLISA